MTRIKDRLLQQCYIFLIESKVLVLWLNSKGCDSEGILMSSKFRFGMK